MSKYNKTAFTLTTLEVAHEEAIRMYTRAYKAGDTSGRMRWHDECCRLETAIRTKKAELEADTDCWELLAADVEEALAETDLIKEFADEQNEAMRTTDMKQPAAEPLCVEALWFKDGVAYARTHSCGCCSEIMSSDADEYDYNEDMTDLDAMAAYVEQEEARVQALRADFNDYCNSQENG